MRYPLRPPSSQGTTLQRLLERGFAEPEVIGVLGGNVMRVLERVWAD